MPKTVVFEGVTHTFPDDFTDAEISQALDSVAPAEAAAAPPEPQGMWAKGIAAEKKRFSEMMGGIGDTLPGAVGNLVNPMSYARTVMGVARVPERVIRAVVNPRTDGAALVEDVSNIAGGIKETGAKLLGMRGARGTGEVIGDLLPSALPLGGIMAKVGNYAKSSRASNIVKATGASKLSDIKKIDKMAAEGRIDLPVSLTRGSIGKHVNSQIKGEVGSKLEAGKAVLPTLPDMAPQFQEAIDALTKRRDKLMTAKGSSGNQALVDALDKQIEVLRNETRFRTVWPEDVQKLKEQFQEAGTPAYQVSPGMAEGTTAAAKKLTAKELRKALENTPGTEALTAANRAMEPLMAMKAPLETQRLGGLKVPSISRSAEMLVGRGLVPAMVGGGALMGGPMGAAAGLGVGAFMQSALWNTLSAAGKAKVAPFLQSGNMQGAVQAAFAAHIAENAIRPEQEQPQ